MNTTFQKIVIDLRAAEFSDIQIAKVCGCSRQYIWKIGKGDINEPGFRIGRKLEKLHEAIQ